MPRFVPIDWSIHTPDIRPVLSRLCITHAVRVTESADAHWPSVNKLRIKLLVNPWRNPWRRNDVLIADDFLTPDQFYTVYYNFDEGVVKFYTTGTVLIWRTSVAELEGVSDPWLRRVSFGGAGGTPVDATHFLCYRLV